MRRRAKGTFNSAFKNQFDHTKEIMDEFIKNEPNFDRSSKTGWRVMVALSTYQQVFTGRTWITQITSNTFLIKMQEIRNTGETESFEM